MTSYADQSAVDTRQISLNTAQSGHATISSEAGSFKSSTESISSSENKATTRKSDYGTEYDFKATATSDTDGKSQVANGWLRYYVDI
jgi:hypothetical protein